MKTKKIECLLTIEQNNYKTESGIWFITHATFSHLILKKPTPIVLGFLENFFTYQSFCINGSMEESLTAGRYVDFSTLEMKVDNKVIIKITPHKSGNIFKITFDITIL